jgi:hypothetical protein
MKWQRLLQHVQVLVVHASLQQNISQGSMEQAVNHILVFSTQVLR